MHYNNSGNKTKYVCQKTDDKIYSMTIRMLSVLLITMATVMILSYYYLASYRHNNAINIPVHNKVTNNYSNHSYLVKQYLLALTN